MTDVAISIDWDYFVPEDPVWDMGHKESKLFLEVLWKSRGHLFEEMRTSGEEHEFWQTLQRWAWLDELPHIAVSDSHLYALEAPGVQAADTLVLFDTHHDLWPLKDAPEQPGKVRIDCGNWLRFWYNEAPGFRTLIWVRPQQDKHENYELPEDMADEGIVVIDGHDALADDASFWLGDDWQLVGLHACRSGCWTPPWLDEAFRQFIFATGLPVVQFGEWDAMAHRWGDADYAQMHEMERVSKEMSAQHTQQQQKDR